MILDIFEMDSKCGHYVFAAHHVRVAGMFGHFHMIPVGSNLFLSLLTTLGLLAGAGFLFGHFCVNRPFSTELAATPTSGYLHKHGHDMFGEHNGELFCL